MTEPRLLGDRYELGPVLGYGGMAEVHRGRDVRLGRDVAIKTLRTDLARDPSFQARFRREAQSAAAINHPAVVAIYDTGESQLDGVNVPYIVMEYVDGRTLRDVLQTDRLLQPHRALEVTAEVLAALDYSHRNGIVHRDIKPGNVMLTRTGDVKVMDFGIARSADVDTSTMTQTAAVLGTAQYLSPEQARGEHVDPRSDVYSVGCLLYELLTGTPPFTGDSPVAVAYQHVRENPVAPSRLNPDISPAVDSIVLKAMAKNPANRYQSAAQMRGDIQRALAGQPVEATPIMHDATTVMAPVAPAAVAEEARRSGRGLVYTLLGVAVIGVVVLVAVLGSSLIGKKSEQVAVKDVVGKQLAEATTILQGQGFVVGKPVEITSDKPAGEVLDQSPPAGTRYTKGKTVTLTIAKGLQKVDVPQLAGLSLTDAINKLKTAGLEFGTTVPQDSDQQVGTVLSSDPPEGQSVTEGTTVNLVIANGKTTVPDVRGLQLSAAQAQLEALGFQVFPTDRASNAAPGTVLDQTPLGSASAGSTINLVVAVAPTPTETPTTPPPTSESPSGSPTTPPPSSPSSTPPSTASP